MLVQRDGRGQGDGRGSEESGGARQSERRIDRLSDRRQRRREESSSFHSRRERRNRPKGEAQGRLANASQFDIAGTLHHACHRRARRADRPWLRRAVDRHVIRAHVHLTNGHADRADAATSDPSDLFAATAGALRQSDLFG